MRFLAGVLEQTFIKSAHKSPRRRARLESRTEERLPVNKKTLVIGATALTVMFAVAACGDSGTDTGTNTAAPNTSTTISTAENSENSEAHDQADVMFARMMIPHHAQAIEMSEILLSKNDIPEPVIALAEQIKAAQGPEIDQLESWLDTWGESAHMPDHRPTGMPGMNHDMSDTTSENGMEGMGGMMSEDEMQALSDAQGAEAARLFLTQMITHHEGAIVMAQNEIADGKFPEAVQTARGIVATQQQEIGTMRQLLENW